MRAVAAGQVLAAPTAVEGVVQIQQEATMSVAALSPSSSVRHALAPGRAGWVHVVSGEVILNGQSLNEATPLRFRMKVSLTS